MRNLSYVFAAIIAAVCAAAGSAFAADTAAPLAFLDMHTHMMVEGITPDDEIARLKQAGIARVLLMHPEPEVVAAFAKKYPGFVIPALSIARPSVKGIHLDDKTGPLMAARYASHDICAFGEIPAAGFADGDAMRSIYGAAEASGAPVIVHTDLANPANIAAVEAAT